MFSATASGEISTQDDGKFKEAFGRGEMFLQDYSSWETGKNLTVNIVIIRIRSSVCFSRLHPAFQTLNPRLDSVSSVI